MFYIKFMGANIMFLIHFSKFCLRKTIFLPESRCLNVYYNIMASPVTYSLGDGKHTNGIESF